MSRPMAAHIAERKEINPVAPKPRVRDRIMQTARDLFYHRGIRAVGVETISSEAGTNKMSFYRCFASKDALVAEYLRGQARELWAWWDATIAPYAGDPGAQIEALFGAMAMRACSEDSRGCALANAASEISDPGHPARAVVEECKGEMRRRFRAFAQESGAREPDALGDALMLLWEGSYLTSLTFRDPHSPATSAVKAARSLLAAYAS